MPCRPITRLLLESVPEVLTCELVPLAVTVKPPPEDELEPVLEDLESLLEGMAAKLFVSVDAVVERVGAMGKGICGGR